MNTPDIVAIIVIALVLAISIGYIVRAKRRGDKCVGCPYAKECGGKCASQHNEKNK